MPQADAEKRVDQVTHADILIAAPPETVWPAIADTNGWHVQKMTHKGGPEGEVGERFDVAHEGVVSMHVENVELVPNVRRTIRIKTPDGAFVGYSTWTLQREGEETRLSYDVYCYFAAPAAMVTADFYAQANARSQEGMKIVKAFVEDGARAA